MNTARPDIVLAYRHLYQHALRAVQFSTPARHVIRDRLRMAFRRGSARDFDAKRIQNTVTFLMLAREPRSLENRVLRSILFAWWHQYRNSYVGSFQQQKQEHNMTPQDRQLAQINAAAYDQFNHLIKMLNESMGLCLR